MLHACMIVLVEICSMPSILVVLSAYNEPSHMHGLCGDGVNGVDGVDAVSGGVSRVLEVSSVGVSNYVDVL